MVLIDVLAGAADIEGDVLTISSLSNPINGLAKVITDAQGRRLIAFAI